MKMTSDDEDIWDVDLPKIKIDKDTKIIGGCIRMRMGLVYTDEEYEKMRKKALETKLP